jgi:DNA (cytosine-5)-methyltransferase 1
LADERGNLALEYLRLADRTRARWLVWENVPGVLSSDEGRDFGAFLGGLAELGYGFAYRVLDAQFFGLAQRRKRVFVVGHIGDWRAPAAVLFERHSLSGDNPPSRDTRESSAGRTARSVAIRGRDGTPQAELGDEVENAILTPTGGRSGVGVGAALIGGLDYENNAHGADEPTGPLLKGSPTGGGRPLPAIAYQTSGNCGAWETGQITGALDTNTDPNSHVICFGSKEHAQDAGDVSPPLRAMGSSKNHPNGGGQIAVAFTASEQANSYAWERDVYPTLNAQIPNDTSNIQTGLRIGSVVRRLTPLECERLQGFPDYYTAIPYRGKAAADGPRYKALGNSMAVPVMAWIGQRIAAVEAVQQVAEAA